MHVTRNDNGFVLPAVLLLVLVLVILGYGVLYLGQTQATESIKQLHNAQAFGLAEAGLHRALWKLRGDTSWSAGWTEQALGNGAYAVVIEDASELGSGWIRLRSTGTVANISRTVTHEVQRGTGWPAAFEYAVFWANPPEEYSPLLTFANSVDILGDVLAYGNVHFTPGAMVGAEGLVYTTGSATGSGFTLGELPEPTPERVVVDTTSYRALVDQARTAPVGDWVVDKDDVVELNGQTILVNGVADIEQKAKIVGPGTIVSAEGINIGMQVEITEGVTLISGTQTTIGNHSSYIGDGNVIYSEGSIEIMNHSSVQGAVIISENDVILRNNTDISGIVWAGAAELENSTYVRGAFYANTFTGDSLENSATIEQDDSVLDYPVPEGFPEGREISVGTWAEE